jgi:hypothetical protein
MLYAGEVYVLLAIAIAIAQRSIYSMDTTLPYFRRSVCPIRRYTLRKCR